MRSLIICLALIVAVGGGHQAAAKTVSIEFRSGRVDLFADQATVPDILREWSRVGGTQIVNEDLAQGPAITLELVDVPESKALDLLLRNVAGGYTAVWSETASSRPSVLDKVFVNPGAALDTVPGQLTPFAAQPASNEQKQPVESWTLRAGEQRLGIPEPSADQSGREGVRAERPSMGIPDPAAHSGDRPAPRPQASGLPDPFGAQVPNPSAEAAARRRGSVGIPQPF